MQLLGQSKEKINLFLLLLGTSQERFRDLQNPLLTTEEKLTRRFFSSQYKPSPIPSGGLKIAIVVNFLIKHLQNLISLNQEELISMDTLQNQVIVDEELGKDCNPEDEDIVFIDDDSERDRQGTVFIIVIKKDRNSFFHLKLFRTLKYLDYKNFGR